MLSRALLSTVALWLSLLGPSCVRVIAPSDSGPDGQGTDAAGTTDGAVDSGPVIEMLRLDAVDPSSGPLAGGYPAMISGAGFTPGTTVSFGTAACSAPTITSPGTLTCTAPAATTAGAVDVSAARPDGQMADLPGGFVYLDDTGIPDWCTHQFPASLVAVEGWPSAIAYGRAFATGVTDSPGPGAGLVGELGFGAVASVPDATWTWTPSMFNVDVDSGVNDEHQAVITAPVAGTYALAFRFSLDGTSWLPCDLDGNAGSPGGYDAGAAAELMVDPPAGGDPDWCNLQFPATLMVAAGDVSPDVYGQIFEPGLTDDGDPVNDIRGPGVIAELGFGPDGSDPSLDPSAWTFVGTHYNVDAGMSLNNDEYAGNVIVPPSTLPGSYDYAYRFSLDGGATFRYCDLDGNDGALNLYDPTMAGALTVP